MAALADEEGQIGEWENAVLLELSANGRHSTLPLQRLRDSPARAWNSEKRPATPFLDDHLLPRLFQQLRVAGSRNRIRDEGQLFKEVYHATQQAFRTFVLESNVWNDMLGRIEQGFGHKAEEPADPGPVYEIVSPSPATPEPRRLGIRRQPKAVKKFDLAISGGSPRLQFRYKKEDTSLRIRLDATGAIGLDLRNSRPMRKTGMTSKLDPIRGRYTVTYRIRF